MKAVKTWGYILVAMIPALYLIGAVTGIFRDSWGFFLYHDSPEAIGIFLLMAVCLLLAISMFVIDHALEQLRRKGDD